MNQPNWTVFNREQSWRRLQMIFRSSKICTFVWSIRMDVFHMFLYSSILLNIRAFPLIRLSLSLSVCAWLYPFVLFFVRLSMSLSVCPWLYPFVLFFVRLSMSLSVCSRLYQFVLFFVRLSMSLSVCPCFGPFVLVFVRPRPFAGLARSLFIRFFPSSYL